MRKLYLSVLPCLQPVLESSVQVASVWKEPVGLCACVPVCLPVCLSACLLVFSAAHEHVVASGYRLFWFSFRHTIKLALCYHRMHEPHIHAYSVSHHATDDAQPSRPVGARSASWVLSSYPCPVRRAHSLRQACRVGMGSIYRNLVRPIYISPSWSHQGQTRWPDRLVRGHPSVDVRGQPSTRSHPSASIYSSTNTLADKLEASTAGGCGRVRGRLHFCFY